VHLDYVFDYRQTKAQTAATSFGTGITLSKSLRTGMATIPARFLGRYRLMVTSTCELIPRSIFTSD